MAQITVVKSKTWFFFWTLWHPDSLVNNCTPSNKNRLITIFQIYLEFNSSLRGQNGTKTTKTTNRNHKRRRKKLPFHHGVKNIKWNPISYSCLKAENIFCLTISANKKWAGPVTNCTCYTYSLTGCLTLV